jgi:hypothetical protein
MKTTIFALGLMLASSVYADDFLCEGTYNEIEDSCQLENGDVINYDFQDGTRTVVGKPNGFFLFENKEAQGWNDLLKEDKTVDTAAARRPPYGGHYGHGGYHGGGHYGGSYGGGSYGGGHYGGSYGGGHYGGSYGGGHYGGGHYDYHPGGYQYHNGHYDYVPGHYDYHHPGHHPY